MNTTAHQDRVSHASQHSLCFACANYCGAFKTLSSICRTGGLDPVNVAPRGNDMTTDAVARFRGRATVLWANSCPRFAPALGLAA